MTSLVSKDALYSLILKQLEADGYSAAAQSIQATLQTAPKTEPSASSSSSAVVAAALNTTTLSDLVARGLESKTRLAIGADDADDPMASNRELGLSSASSSSSATVSRGRPFPAYSTHHIELHKMACRTACFSRDGGLSKALHCMKFNLR